MHMADKKFQSSQNRYIASLNLESREETSNADIVANWKPQIEVWPFSYGLGVLAAASSASGIYFNQYYRRKVHLGSYGRAVTYLPLVVLPAMATFASHPPFVSGEILEGTSCPVCIEVRAVALQLSLGLLYPLVLAPIATFSFATSYYTYPMPATLRELMKTWWSLSKGLSVPINLIAVAQISIAAFVTYSEQKSWSRIKDALRKDDK